MVIFFLTPFTLSASHGYIVVVPQLYLVVGCDATNDVKNVATIINWLPEGLPKVLPPQVSSNLTKLGLAGHSRGGKDAFAHVLKRVKMEVLKLKFFALIGISPVDGMGAGKQTPPKVLTYIPHSFNLGMPVMVIGGEHDEVKGSMGFPCAPKGVNHEDFYKECCKDFYKECCKPACYFVAKDCRHLDILDDNTAGIRGMASYCFCKNRDTREPMGRFVGGIVVAFLKGYLEGDLSFLMAIKDGEIVPPVVLQTIDFQL